MSHGSKKLHFYIRHLTSLLHLRKDILLFVAEFLESSSFYHIFSSFDSEWVVIQININFLIKQQIISIFT